MESGMYTISEVSEIMNIGRHQAERLVRSPGFPCIKIGRTYRVPKDEFERWVRDSAYSGRPFVLK